MAVEENLALVRRFIFRAEGGKLTDAWGDFDALGMQRQLGLLPAG